MHKEYIMGQTTICFSTGLEVEVDDVTFDQFLGKDKDKYDEVLHACWEPKEETLLLCAGNKWKDNEGKLFPDVMKCYRSEFPENIRVYPDLPEWRIEVLEDIEPDMIRPDMTQVALENKGIFAVVHWHHEERLKKYEWYARWDPEKKDLVIYSDTIRREMKMMTMMDYINTINTLEHPFIVEFLRETLGLPAEAPT